MFFYLFINSTLIKRMKISEREKTMRIFIFGVIAYTLLHAVMFIGGKESLLYNFKNYFWIILILDVVTNVFMDETTSKKIFDALPNLLGSKDDEELESDNYRLIVPNASLELEEPKTETLKKKPKKKVKEKKEKKSVKFSDNWNSHANPIPDRDIPNVDTLLNSIDESYSRKSVPLNELGGNSESDFSDSDSDFTTDLDTEMNNFEKGLSF